MNMNKYFISIFLLLLSNLLIAQKTAILCKTLIDGTGKTILLFLYQVDIVKAFAALRENFPN